jgi:hypothetical protein
VGGGGGIIMNDELGRILNEIAAYCNTLLPNLDSGSLRKITAWVMAGTRDLLHTKEC